MPYYLLLSSCGRRECPDADRLPPGALLVEDASNADHRLRSVDQPSQLSSCSESQLRLLSGSEADLLRACRSPADRLAVLQHPDWLRAGRYAEVGQVVEVTADGNWEHSAIGIVRSRCRVPHLAPGVLFGVEILSDPSLGNTDGSVGGQHYFKCVPNAGVFVPISHLKVIASSHDRISSESDEKVSLSGAGNATFPRRYSDASRDQRHLSGDSSSTAPEHSRLAAAVHSASHLVPHFSELISDFSLGSLRLPARERTVSSVLHEPTNAVQNGDEVTDREQDSQKPPVSPCVVSKVQKDTSQVRGRDSKDSRSWLQRTMDRASLRTGARSGGPQVETKRPQQAAGLGSRGPSQEPPPRTNGVTEHTREPRMPVELPEVTPDVYKIPPEVAETLPLRVGDKVYWISDTGPEPGWVRWIGKLVNEDFGRDWMVGVEFENPIGSGNGCYRGHRLFNTKLRHASIIPIAGLIRAEDFDSNSPPPLPPHGTVTNESKNTAPSESSRLRLLEVHTSDEEEPPRPPPPKGHEFTDDLSHMTAFHRLAYQQLAGNNSISNNSNHAYSNNRSAEELPEPHIRSKQHYHLYENGGTKPRRKLPLSDLSNTRIVLGPDRRRQKKKEQLNNSFEAEIVHHQHENDSLSPRDVDVTWVDPDMTVGSAVEVDIQGLPQYGVVRWIGHIKGDSKRRLFAGVEMEEEAATGCDGAFSGVRYFTCPPGKALFVPLADCRKDRRFLDVTQDSTDSNNFGSVECPVISGDVAPIAVTSTEELRKLCGKFRGIQGHLNSCYLDATLFSMFTFTPVLDCLLYRPKMAGDIPEYTEVQRLLKEEIVNPLRSAMFVRADRVMKLRQKLETLSSVRGLTSEEKDPEEFLQSLLAQILHADPFLRYSSGQESYLYQLIVEKDDRLVLPSVQQLFDQSFLSGDIKLKEVPSCLIVQMPRFGKDYKMYPRILPSMVLDVTDVIENSPRQCYVCGKLAEWECKQCFSQGLGLSTTAFCSKCNTTSHNHQSRQSHTGRQRLRVPREFTELREFSHIPRCYLELFAVVCIHTSHYVTFAKTGLAPDAGWVFFDSMADRKGEAHGYNIPEMVSVPDLPRWLSEEGTQSLLSIRDDKHLPEPARRLLCDGYMCFYQSRDVMMYR